MKLSTKARYGLYTALLLADNYYNGSLSVADIAAKTGVSEKYLEQVISLLKKGGVVNAQRGAKGGYCLAHKPSEVSVGMVLRSCEDNLRIVDCIGNNCKKNCTCVSHKLFTNLYKNINDYLDSISLEQLSKENDNENILG